MTKTTICLAALGLLAAVPAAARTAAPSPQPAADVQPQHGPNTRYCLVTEPITGSHIRTRACHTRADWERKGVELNIK